MGAVAGATWQPGTHAGSVFESFSIFFSSLSAAISDFSSLDGDCGGALAVWRGCREGDEWLQLWCVAA